QLPYRNSQISKAVCLGGCDLPATPQELEQMAQLSAQLEELKTKYAAREAEIAELAELKAKLAQREAEIQTLQNRNAERGASAAKLVARIQDLEQTSANVGSTRTETDAELARLRSELTTIQQDRLRDAAKLEQQNANRAREFASLRTHETEALRLNQDVDRYRRQVQDLQH